MRRTPYVTNAEILFEFKTYWKTGIISDNMTKIIYKIARKIANSRNFYMYPYKEDMIQEGVFHVINRGITGFTQGRDNPFAYFTTIISFKFIEYIKKDKKNVRIRELAKEKLIENIKDNINRRK